MEKYWWIQHGDKVVPCEVLNDKPDNVGCVVVYLIGYDDKVELQRVCLLHPLHQPVAVS